MGLKASGLSGLHVRRWGMERVRCFGRMVALGGGWPVKE